MKETVPLNNSDSSLISWVSDVSDYEIRCLVQHVKNPTNDQDSFNLYILSMFSPVLFYETYSINVLSQTEKPLQAGESFKLLGVKFFSKQRQDKTVTTKFLLTYVRSTPNTPPAFVNQLKSVVVTFVKTDESFVSLSADAAHIVGPQIVMNGNADKEFNANKFTIATATSGESTATQTLFVIYYYSQLGDNCQASVMSYDNNQLSLLKALQSGPSRVGCKVGLKSFTYDASTIMLFELNTLAAITIDSKSGDLTVKSQKSFNLMYDDILSSANIGAVFVGNDGDKTTARSTQFIALFSNLDSHFTKISQITWNGNEFSTYRLIPLRSKLPALTASFINNYTAQLVYEDAGIYRTVMVAFTTEVEKDYTMATAFEGVHFSIGVLSPSAWSIASPNYCPLKSCIQILQSPSSLNFNSILFETPTNCFGLIGIATQDGKAGEQVNVVTSGTTPVGTFKNNVKFVSGKNYYAMDLGDSSRLTISPPFETRGLLVGKAINQNQILVDLLQEP